MVAKKRTHELSQFTQIVSYNPITAYMEEIKKYPRLTREEEHDLAVRFWKHRDKHAAFMLITSNLLFVVKLVMEFRTKQQNLLDLIQEGNIGLIEALNRFDPYRNVRFSTYASWWIRAYILKHILDNWSIVKIGTTNKKRKLFYNLKKEMASLEAMGISPGPKLLADRLQVDEKEVIEMSQSIEKGDVYLDAPVGEEGTTTLIDMLSDEGASVEKMAADEQLRNIINEKLGLFKKRLSERELVILEERVLAETPKTLQEIANRFHKTKEAIRYTETKVIESLKAYLTREIPDLHLDLMRRKE